MKSHTAHGIKFISYSRPDAAVEVTWNIHGDQNVNQFLQNFVLFAKANFLHIFILHKNYLFPSKMSTSSFDEQDVLWIRLWFLHRVRVILMQVTSNE